MNMPNTDEVIREILRKKIAERDISLRELGKLSGVNFSTISRVINGSRRPTLSFLKKVAPHLGLMQAMETFSELYSHEKTELGQTSSLNLPTDTLPVEALNLYKVDLEAQIDVLTKLEHGIVEKRFNNELEKYKIFARTEEALDLIKNNFYPKLKRVCLLPELSKRLQTLYQQLNESLPSELKIVICAALVYFILPIDLVPDYLMPLGFLDDSIIITMVWRQLANV